MTDESQETHPEDVQSLNDVFSEGKSETPKDDSQKVEKEPEVKAEIKAETPKELEAETTAAKNESVPVKALLEERRKRQDLENRLQQLQNKQTETPDVFEDTQGFTQNVKESAVDVATQQKIALSRDLMRDSKEDFDDMEAVFLEMVGFDKETQKATKNLHLVAEMNNSANPAKFVYQQAKDHLLLQEVAKPDFMQRLKDELRAEILEEQKAQGKASAKDMPDLSKATESGKNSNKVEKKATLDEVFEGSAI